MGNVLLLEGVGDSRCSASQIAIASGEQAKGSAGRVHARHRPPLPLAEVAAELGGEAVAKGAHLPLLQRTGIGHARGQGCQARFVERRHIVGSRDLQRYAAVDQGRCRSHQATIGQHALVVNQSHHAQSLETARMRFGERVKRFDV